MTSLRTSVSNWIVSGSDPQGSLLSTSTDDLFYSIKKQQMVLAQTNQNVTESSNTPPFDFLDLFQGAKKRALPTAFETETVDPAAIFTPTLEAIRSFITPPAKKVKLSDSNDNVLDISSSNSFYPFSNSPTHNTENNIDSIDEIEDDEEEEKSCESDASFSEQNEEFDEDYEEYSDFEEEDIQDFVVSTQTSDNVNGNSAMNIRAQLSFGKRGNGNQPWTVSCVAPPKIGKMRRITLELALSATVNTPVQILVRAKTVDKQPKKHPGKLVLCNNDRCCVKVREEGKKKPVIKCDQRCPELVVPVELTNNVASVDWYLKPEWNGLGQNKTRPKFEVSLEILDAHTNAVIGRIIHWEVELQSHKFESSQKAKSMENSGDHSKTIEIPLSH